MASTPLRYLTVGDVRAINEAVLGQEGQAAVLRDQMALEGALASPQTAAHYEQVDLIMQAAILIARVALAHAFVDGNKRTAAIVGAVFLELNGNALDVIPADDSYGREVEALVIHHADFGAATQRLVDWLRTHTTPIP